MQHCSIGSSLRLERLFEIVIMEMLEVSDNDFLLGLRMHHSGSNREDKLCRNEISYLLP